MISWDSPNWRDKRFYLSLTERNVVGGTVVMDSIRFHFHYSNVPMDMCFFSVWTISVFAEFLFKKYNTRHIYGLFLHHYYSTVCTVCTGTPFFFERSKEWGTFGFGASLIQTRLDPLDREINAWDNRSREFKQFRVGSWICVKKWVVTSLKPNKR